MAIIVCRIVHAVGLDRGVNCESIHVGISAFKAYLSPRPLQFYRGQAFSILFPILALTGRDTTVGPSESDDLVFEPFDRFPTEIRLLIWMITLSAGHRVPLKVPPCPWSSRLGFLYSSDRPEN